MKTHRFLMLAFLLAASVAVISASAHEHPTITEHPQLSPVPIDPHNLVTVASGMEDLSTLVTAIQAAGLTKELQGKGPFTVFAPSNEAFAKLPAGTLDDLLKPANKAQLAGILACHVVPGKILAADIKTMKATNIAGLDLNLEVAEGFVTVDGAEVVSPDILATNGVIQIIDEVLLPSEQADMPASEKPKDHPAH